MVSFCSSTHKSFLVILFINRKNKIPTSLLFLFLILNTTNHLLAEGTKELAPNLSDVTALYTCEPNYDSFASYNVEDQAKLFVHIADPENEQVYLGFSQWMLTFNANDGDYYNGTYYFQIVDPEGTIVFGPIAINAATANTNTHALAVAGPAPIVGGTGYTPFTYVPDVGAIAGDYAIEFSNNVDASFSSFTDIINTAEVTFTGIAIKYFDITVATQDPSPAAINGRTWSYSWSLRTPSISHGSDPTYTYFDRPFNGQLYSYSDDGIVMELLPLLPKIFLKG